MSTTGNTVSYEEVKAATTSNTTYIIDVREQHELQATGGITNSLNIPLGDVARVLESGPEQDFIDKYGRLKPVHSANIIFSCGAGVRAAKAAEAAIKLGFVNSKIYSGSWKDWAEHLNQ